MKKKEKRIFNYMLYLNKSEWKALDAMEKETGQKKGRSSSRTHRGLFI